MIEPGFKRESAGLVSSDYWYYPQTTPCFPLDPEFTEAAVLDIKLLGRWSLPPVLPVCTCPLSDHNFKKLVPISSASSFSLVQSTLLEDGESRAAALWITASISQRMCLPTSNALSHVYSPRQGLPESLGKGEKHK